jgi:hypothetical protein
LHGAGQVIGRLRRRRRIDRGLPPDPVGAAEVLRARIVTFHLVCLGWVFFRADSIGSAFEVLGRLVRGWDEGAGLATPLVAATIAGMVLVQNLPRTPAARLQIALSRLAPVLQGVAIALVLFGITSLGPEGVTPFIYFQF